jgi:hypothetical protein
MKPQTGKEQLLAVVLHAAEPLTMNSLKIENQPRGVSELDSESKRRKGTALHSFESHQSKHQKELLQHLAFR